VKAFLDGLSDSDAASIVAGMKDVQINGNRVAHQLFRVLYATEGKEDQVLLALEAFSKKTKKTPGHIIQLAKRRLTDWRSRARE
jgi:phage-related protein